MIFGTRPSALARWQTRWVIDLLQTAWTSLDCREKVITTTGDRILDKPLPEIGGKGLFTEELERAILSGQVDAAVHSLKDLPVENPNGILIAAIPQRADARDVLISADGWRLDTLPEGSRVGTSSLRRSSQLLALRPDLQIESLRGNVDTRLKKALEKQYDAIILAGAGIDRLGLNGYVSERLPYSKMLPAPGQGALAVQCRAEDSEAQRLLAVLDDHNTHTAVLAERSFLTALGGGCSLPVGAFASWEQGVINLNGIVASLDGKTIISVSASGQDPVTIGKVAAMEAIAKGAAGLLRAPALQKGNQ
jgi:hydroxymethylbilane synthase